MDVMKLCRQVGEDLEKARCTFAVYFFEEEPHGGWPAPVISLEEFQELHTVPLWDTGEPTPFVNFPAETRSTIEDCWDEGQQRS